MRTDVNASLLPPRIELVRGPRDADARTLRMCLTITDAIRASIQLSGLTYREIGARMNVSKSLVNAYAKGERELPRKRFSAFCVATGVNLVRQFDELERALRMASEHPRERDRIAEIIAPTERAWQRGVA